MEKKTKKWGLVLFLICGVFCCWKTMEFRGGKGREKERKSVIKMKNCNGCWVISFK